MTDNEFQLLNAGDALILIDIQNDFLPGGSMGVSDGQQILKPVNHAIEVFVSHSLPVFAVRDWHPPNHCSFQRDWPRHCVVNTMGAEFPRSLRLPRTAQVISKGTIPEPDAYSGFERTQLQAQLRAMEIRRLFIAGLGTELCINRTAQDAIKFGFQVLLIGDGIRALNRSPLAGQDALIKVEQSGAIIIHSGDLLSASAQGVA